MAQLFESNRCPFGKPRRDYRFNRNSSRGDHFNGFLFKIQLFFLHYRNTCPTAKRKKKIRKEEGGMNENHIFQLLNVLVQNIAVFYTYNINPYTQHKHIFCHTNTYTHITQEKENRANSSFENYFSYLTVISMTSSSVMIPQHSISG